MKKKLMIIIGLVLAAALVGGGIWYSRYTEYHATYIIIEDTEYLRAEKHLDLSGQNIADPMVYAVLTELETLNLRGTGLTCGQYDALREALPGCEILWDVPFRGGTVENTAEELTLDGLTEADVAMLGYFPRLKRIDAAQCRDYDVLLNLMAEHPDWEVTYSVPLGGEIYPMDTAELTLKDASLEEMEKWLPMLPELTYVTLEGVLPEGNALRQLTDTMEGVEFYWQTDVMGIPVDTNTETLDLTRITMTVEDIESKLPYLPKLRYVDMSFCGISNEEMDALNRRWEDIKIVWTVNIAHLRVRTDADYFMPNKDGSWVGTKDCYNLRYCTDMICVDIGHMPVKDCEWVRFMPKLKYLLLGDTDISDLSPLEGLTELVFLEIFKTYVTDYTPLLSLTALEDINLHYTYGDPEIIAKMTWLNNVWWYQIPWEDQQMLREAMPDTHFEFNCSAATGAGWRKLQNYYDHRDIMGMWYMN